MARLSIAKDAAVHLMWEVVKHLPNDQQECLKMYYVDNYPAVQCADAVGLSLEDFVALKRVVRQRFLDSVASVAASAVTNKPEAHFATAGRLQ